MNAKKIMGAVLVALLALTAFAGVAAAADLGTYFPSQTANVAGLTNGTWTSGSNQVIVDNHIIQAYSVVAGTYKNGDNTSYFTNPTANYKATGKAGGISYPIVNGGNLYQGDWLNLSISPLANVGATNMLVTYPNGSVLNVTANALDLNKLGLGAYKVVAIFNKGDFAADMDDSLLFDTLNSFTFNVVKAEDATISASVENAFSGEAITVDVVGKPGATYGFNLTNVDIATKQYVELTAPSGSAKTYTFVMPNNGKATFQLTINSASANKAVADTDSKTAIIQLVYGSPLAVVDDGEIKIKISAPVVTATLEAPSYFITQNITVLGTASAEVKANNFVFNLSGTNIDEFTLGIGEDSDFSNGKEWEADLFYTKKLDVGTYTIKIYQGTEVVASVPVALKQPFISIISAPEVVVQNTAAEFLINAEAAADIKAYFFGTNFYFAATDIQKKNKDALNEFTVTVPKSKTNNMSAGQYFVVFQHPMYDGKFNIMAFDGQFVVNTSEQPNSVSEGQKLFNATERQTANAAQALCDALDNQEIDDMYVKYSFFIVGEDESFTIAAIPTEVAQGETFTISGVSTANAGKFVTVEMVSTAFAAVPKETVGSASFIAVTTKVADDGTWEITMDTSDLNVDEYSLTVACSGEDKPWKNVKINVVEAGDEPVNPEQPEEPEQPEQPEEPVAPATPGFGALAALAGLGAVAVLLLRRE